VTYTVVVSISEVTTVVATVSVSKVVVQTRGVHVVMVSDAKTPRQEQALEYASVFGQAVA
jgi:hypothetical protein